ncbi:DUF4333 domain-containing protein [Streptomyces lincolnensis]|uniref:DUF4333 domain-containing protein n=1 Tax=Streptomyces lincolnensis TaxID=1915 RepID=UPI0037D7D423
MRHSGFVVGAVGGAIAVAAVGAGFTHVFAAKDLQHTTLDLVRTGLYVTVDGHPAVHHTILESRIEGWYHPLPWVGRKIHDVSCPTHLPAVVGARETCTARSDGGRIEIPVSVVEVEGKPTEPTVFWKFAR